MSVTLANLTPEDAIQRLWQICDKPERIRALDIVDRALGLDDIMFWTSFWEMWTSHESIFLDHAIIEEMLKRHDVAKAHLGLDDDEQEALAALPDPIEIYRGCRSHNTEGWSWTLDYDKAKWFANRSAGKGQPLVLHAIVPRAKVLAFLTGRGESEIVVQPIDALVHFREKLPRLSKRVESHNALYQSVQARSADFHAEASAQLLVINNIMMNADLAALRANAAIDFGIAEMFGSNRALMLREVVRLLDDRLAGGTTLDPMVNALSQTKLVNFQM